MILNFKNQKAFLDVAEPCQLGFQNPSTFFIIEEIINFHYNLMFFLLILTTFICWMLFKTIFLSYEKKKFEIKYINLFINILKKKIKYFDLNFFINYTFTNFLKKILITFYIIYFLFIIVLGIRGWIILSIDSFFFLQDLLEIKNYKILNFFENLYIFLNEIYFAIEDIFDTTCYCMEDQTINNQNQNLSLLDFQQLLNNLQTQTDLQTVDGYQYQFTNQEERDQIVGRFEQLRVIDPDPSFVEVQALLNRRALLPNILDLTSRINSITGFNFENNLENVEIGFLFKNLAFEANNLYLNNLIIIEHLAEFNDDNIGKHEFCSILEKIQNSNKEYLYLHNKLLIKNLNLYNNFNINNTNEKKIILLNILPSNVIDMIFSNYLTIENSDFLEYLQVHKNLFRFVSTLDYIHLKQLEFLEVHGIETDDTITLNNIINNRSFPRYPFLENTLYLDNIKNFSLNYYPHILNNEIFSNNYDTYSLIVNWFPVGENLNYEIDSVGSGSDYEMGSVGSGSDYEMGSVGSDYEISSQEGSDFLDLERENLLTNVNLLNCFDYKNLLNKNNLNFEEAYRNLLIETPRNEILQSDDSNIINKYKSLLNFREKNLIINSSFVASYINDPENISQNLENKGFLLNRNHLDFQNIDHHNNLLQHFRNNNININNENNNFFH